MTGAAARTSFTGGDAWVAGAADLAQEAERSAASATTAPERMRTTSDMIGDPD